MSDDRDHQVFRYGGNFAEQRIVRSDGPYIYDDEDREILDFTSGQMSGILGHGHPEIVAVVRDMVAELDHLHSGFLSAPVTKFAAALADMLPAGLDRVLPLSTGGEANEAALRMAKTYTGGFEVVAFDRSWHGVTGGAAATTYAGGRRGHGPHRRGDFDPAHTARLPLALQSRRPLRLAPGVRIRLGHDRPPVDRPVGRRHRRAHPQRRRYHRAARGLPGGAAGKPVSSSADRICPTL